VRKGSTAGNKKKYRRWYKEKEITNIDNKKIKEE